jgi:predicted phage terminase large subunit-like protein
MQSAPNATDAPRASRNAAALATLDDVARERARRSRTSFLAYRKMMNPTAKWGWFQLNVAHELQRFRNDLFAGRRPKLVIQAPPQHGKSIQAIDFIGWLSGQNPDLRTIYTSFSDRLGVRANLRLQRAFDSERYRLAFPDTRIAGSGGAASTAASRSREFIEFVGREGYFRNTTVRGSITGESLDLGVIDDPIRGRADARSIAHRDAAWDWFTDDFFTRFSEEAGLLAILTRWHVDDPIGRLLEADPTVRVLTYEAIATTDEPHRRAGEALFPELKSLGFLLERKAIMPAGHFAALYQQRPTLDDGEMFKPEKIEVVDALPAGTIRWVRGWDLAATQDDGAYTAGGKLGLLPDGRLIIGDMLRKQLGPDARDAALKNTASQDGRGVRISLPQDPGQAGKSQVLHLQRLLSGYPVHTSPESGDKALRAEPMASAVNVGNVLMLRGPWNAALLEELRTFPNGTYLDQVDALSRAHAHLVGGNTGMLDFASSEAKTLANRREQQAQAEAAGS